jgi:hypothetical protein
LSRDRLIAVLTPTHVALLRRGANGAHQTLQTADCPPAQAGMHDWHAAADTLAQVLSAAAPRRGRLAVVLSSHFVRFRLIAWSEAVGTPDELDAYARIAFEEVYGAAVATWAVRVSPEGPGGARLAAAIEASLLDQLTALAQAAGLRLVSVEPHLAATFNRCLPRLKGDDFVLAVTEPGRCSLLVARGGNWVSVRSGAAGETGDALGAMLVRECELGDFADNAPPALYVHAADGEAGPWPAVQGEVPQALGFGAACDPWTGMARVVA